MGDDSGKRGRNFSMTHAVRLQNAQLAWMRWSRKDLHERGGPRRQGNAAPYCFDAHKAHFTFRFLLVLIFVHGGSRTIAGKKFDDEEEDENVNVHSSYGTTKHDPQIAKAASYNECLDLMHRLMAYRHEPIHSELMRIRDKYSMLHVDVLILIYHFAKLCSGAILEIGAFVGGATIAAALGVRDSGQEKKLITIEPGGSVKHKRLATRNILRDLERNLARERVANMVTLVKGKSFKPETMSDVRQALGSNQVGLLVLDADAAKRRDIDCYRDKFAEGSWMVIDDIYGVDANEKITPSRADVDALVSEGLLEPMGFYGWSTWIGRWRGSRHH
jgi:predicted O-methyltransferase YrrM